MESRVGSKNPNWKGDTIAVSGDGKAQHARHGRVRRLRGRASSHPCLGISIRCTGYGAEWATLHGRNGLDPYQDYVPLCRKCHFFYDKPGVGKGSNFGGYHGGTNKLEFEEVSEIKRLLRIGVRRSILAKRFDVSVKCIGNIATGRTWSEVD